MFHACDEGGCVTTCATIFRILRLGRYELVVLTTSQIIRERKRRERGERDTGEKRESRERAEREEEREEETEEELVPYYICIDRYFLMFIIHFHCKVK